MDEALVARVLNPPSAPGEVYSSRSPLWQAREQGQLAPLGAWWDTPEAAAAEAQLAEASQSLPTPLSADGVVHDLLAFPRPHGGPATMHVRRRVAFTDAAEPNDALAMPPPTADDAWVEHSNDSEPSVLVLQHRFRLADGRELTLRTCMFSGYNIGVSTDMFSHAAFGAVPVAVQPDWGRAIGNRQKLAATAVAIDGSWLTAAQLGLLPKAVREVFDSCREAQRVATTRSVLRHRWPGGFGMMRVSVAPVLSHAACAAMQALAASLCLARAGGLDTYQLLHIRTWYAECLEAQGLFSQASGQCMLNLVSQASWGSKDDPSDAWANLGLALTQMGDYPAAIMAFHSALTANDAMVRHDDMHDRGLTVWFAVRRDRTAAQRESQRLRLLEMQLVTAMRMEAPPRGDAEQPTVVDSAQIPASSLTIHAMFQRYFIQGVDTQPPDHIPKMSAEFVPGGILCATSLHSGARFVLRKRFAPGSFAQVFNVERVPPGSPLPSETGDPLAEAAQRAAVPPESFMAHARRRALRHREPRPQALGRLQAGGLLRPRVPAGTLARRPQARMPRHGGAGRRRGRAAARLSFTLERERHAAQLAPPPAAAAPLPRRPRRCCLLRRAPMHPRRAAAAKG